MRRPPLGARAGGTGRLWSGGSVSDTIQTSLVAWPSGVGPRVGPAAPGAALALVEKNPKSLCLEAGGW